MKRLIFRDTVSELWTNLAGFDGILLRTLKDLSRSPGSVAKAYIAGIRIRYIGPIAYFFFMITLLLLWVNALGTEFAELIRDRQQSLALVQTDRKGLAMITQWIGDNIKWFLFLAVPFQAFAARFFFFRRSGHNLVEHAVPLFYAGGHLFWLTMVSVLIRKLTGELYSLPFTLLTLAYFGFLYADMMNYQSRVKAFAKGLGVYLAGQLLFVATMTVGIIVVFLVLSVVNPEALEPFRSSRP